MSAVVLSDEIGADWVRRAHWMAENRKILDDVAIPAHAKRKIYSGDLRLQHLEAQWQLREATVIPDQVGKVTAYWHVVIWWIGETRVSQAMREAAEVFAIEKNVDPTIALIRSIPPKATEFVEVDGVALVQAGWVLPGFLVVTTGGMWSGLPAYKLRSVTNETQ
jgi:hypothetical protein